MNNPAFLLPIVLLTAVLSGAAACGAEPELAAGRPAAVAQLSRGCGGDAPTVRQPVVPSRPQPIVAMCR